MRRLIGLFGRRFGKISPISFYLPPSNGSRIGQLIFPALNKKCFKKIKKPNKSNKQTNKKRNKTKQNKQVRKTKILHRTVSYKRTNHVPSYTSAGESIAVYWLFRAMLRYRLAHIVHMICTVNSVLVSRS